MTSILNNVRNSSTLKFLASKKTLEKKEILVFCEAIELLIYK
jgi:hypothetical protein